MYKGGERNSVVHVVLHFSSLYESRVGGVDRNDGERLELNFSGFFGPDRNPYSCNMTHTSVTAVLWGVAHTSRHRTDMHTTREIHIPIRKYHISSPVTT